MNKLWEVLYNWNHSDAGEFDQIWNGYSNLSDETGISEKELKKIMKKLRDANIMMHAPTINSDYIPSGSGNFLMWPYSEKPLGELIPIFEATLKAGENDR